MPDIKSYSLSSILKSVKNAIYEKTNGKFFWIKAEISNIKLHPASGHYYLEIVETKDKITIAQCRATIWASHASNIKNELKTDFDNILKKGSEILFYGSIVFNEVYGFSLDITEVNLNFNLGDLEKRKQETINKLKEEGLIDRNKQKIAPIVIKRIALISSIGSSGYEDFYKQLNQNQYGYIFEVTDFPVSVQGDNAVSEICSQLNKLNSLNYDIVAILRGGGSKLDLDVFNNYELAKTIALHNLPIYTGIGHETDFSVADIVASKSLKTPTALGAHIVEVARTYHVQIMTYWVNIKQIYNLYIEKQKNKLDANLQTLTTKSIYITQLRRGNLHQTMNRINSLVIEEINSEKSRLKLTKQILSNQPYNKISNSSIALKNSMQLIQVNFSSRIKRSVDDNNYKLKLLTTLAQNQCKEKSKYINNILEVITVYHPNNILNKGYAIPRFNGNLLNNQVLRKGDEIEIELLKRKLIVSFLKEK